MENKKEGKKEPKLRKFIVKGVEEVYGAFDEFERVNPLEAVEVECVCLEGAINKGQSLLQRKINEEHYDSGEGGSDRAEDAGLRKSYVAKVEQVLDLEGKVLYEHITKRIKL